MGLFNSGKNEKVEKVSKYERHYNVPQGSTRRRSSKHRSQHGEPSTRAMSQPPMMRAANPNLNGPSSQGFYQPPNVFSPPMVGTINPNVLAAANIMPPNGIPQVRYPIQPFDLSKFTPGAFPANPFNGGQMAAMNLSPAWNNALPLANNRSPFQQPLNEYQQAPWQPMSPSNYGYLPPMQF